ncbi:DNA-binding protein [Curtobacterium sp. 458]|uniref:DNA-binding protein n=1 Tax=Curtobacterium sp. 458 TaxID=3050069 RepID=UPI0025B33832|nr:DNA-binding protein [Curtobacterium sp. 458]WJX99434.1 DNA-binding protein [Curtobacterium sp. 458]
MIVITADQIDSRAGSDRVETALLGVSDVLGDAAVLPPERTAGDEFQVLVSSGGAAVDVVRALTRQGGWSIGVGVGAVESPLPTSTRAATGPAFYAARAAVERAKSTPERFALEVAPGASRDTSEVEPLFAQTVRALGRRSAEGWELADLLDAGLSRTEAAARLDITPQAVAKRYASAELRSDAPVRAALAALLESTDRPADEERTP